MPRPSRLLVILLVGLIISPFTVPLSSCELGLLLGPARPRQARTDARDSTARLTGVSITVIAMDESRRIKDDSDTRLAPPEASVQFMGLPDRPAARVWFPERPHSAPLVLRI